MPEKITLHEITPNELKAMLLDIVDQKLEELCGELQEAFGEDDLVSTGTASRLLGVSNKTLKVFTDRGEFSVFYHLKEKRYKRGELLEYRNRFLTKRKKG